MADVAELPPWVLSGARLVEIDATTITLASDGTSPIEFGDVPRGWHVTVKGLGNSSQTLRVSTCEGVTWRLESLGRRQVLLDGPFVDLEVTSARPRQPALLQVEHDGVRFRMGQGRFRVDGSGRRFSLIAAARSTVEGTAQLREVTGSGNLQVSSPPAHGFRVDDFVGAISLAGDLTEPVFNARGAELTIGGEVSGATGVVKSMTLTGVLRDSVLAVEQSVRLQGGIERSTVEVDEAGDGTLAIDAKPVAGQIYGARQQPVAVPIVDSILVSLAAGVVDLPHARNTRITSAGSVRIAGDYLWDESDGAGRVLEASGLAIGGDLSLTKDAEVFGGKLTEIGGDLTGGAIRGDEIEVGGKTSATHVIASVVRLNSALELSTVECGELCLKGPADAASTMHLTGESAIDGQFDGVVRWWPAEGEPSLRFGGSVSRLHVAGGDAERAKVKFGPGVDSVTQLTIGRRTTVATDQSEVPLTIHIATLGDDKAPLVFALERSVVLESIEFEGFGAIGRIDSGKPDLVLNVDGARDLQVDGRGKVTLETTERRDLPPSLFVSGPGPFHINTELALVHSARTAPPWSEVAQTLQAPCVNVRSDGAILALSGEFSLQALDGRINGVRDNDGKAPRLLTIDGELRSNRGLLTGVDPTELPYEELDALERLYVFEPDGKALIRVAKKGGPNTFANRELAQRMHRIGELVGGRPISGTARSAALWAASRTHHRVASNRLERLLRWVHRFFGYSQRPLPALWTWLVVCATTATVLHCGEPMHPGEGQELVDHYPTWWNQFVRAMVLPVSLLRLPQGSAPLVWDNFNWHVVAFVLLGVPLVFFIIALKNFMSSPVDG